MDLSKHVERALQYVRDNRTWSDAEEQVALERIDYMRCGVAFASPEIAQQIRELMDDYGQGEDLPENWWEDFGDEDNIFLKL
jgi:hypothetical protein